MSDPTFDRAAVRAHLEMLHSLATASRHDGVLVLCGYGQDPDTERKVRPVVQRFSIGAVDEMTDVVMAYEGYPHLNLYAPWAIYRHGLTGKERGDTDDIVCTLALPVDLDADKGKTGKLPLPAPYVIESSAGNFQPVYPLTRALPPAEATMLATALGEAVNSDPGTKDIIHIWRIGGTVNWPNAEKVNERGRPRAPQPVKVATPWTGELVEPETLQAAIAEHVHANGKANGSRGHDHTGSDWQLLFTVLPASLRKLIVSPPLPDEDRSAVAASVILSLIGRGWSDAKIAAMIHAHPQGIGARYAEGSDLEADIRRLRGKHEGGKHEERARAEPATPIDLWAKLEPPALPRGLLPDVIERFAFEQGEMMGVDPAGLAMAALAVCAAAIPDRIQLQVKEHDTSWQESARLWVGIIGPPSTKKTPLLKQATRPLTRLDAELAKAYAAQKAEYDALSADDRKSTTPPKKTRLRIEDCTPEAAGEILRDSPDGVLALQDELSGWFGGMDKYSRGHGGHKDRAFWLQAWNGGDHCIERIGRGSIYIPNLSVSLLGGIQPGPLRKIIDDTVDDGLIQRLIPITLRTATVGKDAARPDVVREYEDLVEHLHCIGQSILPGLNRNHRTVHFTPEAQVVRQRLEQKHVDLISCETFNPKLAAHLGKYDSFFARLCLVWHCIEHSRAGYTNPISESVALRVEQFLHKFLLPHAVAFYVGALQLADDHDRLSAVCNYILAHKLTAVSPRDIARGDRSMRRLSKAETSTVFEQLEALGWLEQVPGPRKDAPRWQVNVKCHQQFAERAEKEAQRRQLEREKLRDLFGMVQE